MPSPNLHLTFRDGGTGDAGDQYTGLDRFGRLVETLWKQGGSDRVRSKYGRNQVGGVVWRRDEEAHAQGKNTQDNYYGYDGLQQVKQRQRGDLTGTAPDYTGITNLQQEEDWTYDATGNWSACSNTSPTNGQTRTHNPANEITEISSSPGDVTPAYDPVGNMLTLPKEPGTSTEQYDLVWDAWNRLVAVKDGGTTVASYTYDGLTRRQTRTNAAETRHYYYNAAWRALEERVEGAISEIDRQFTWGLRDRWDLLRRKRSVSGSLDETLYVLRDYLDPVAIVGESGAVVERYAYDAFGNVRFLAPDYSSRTGSDFDWEFLFHAEFRDLETKLYNYGYRYYDIGLGRWLSKDPIEPAGLINLYALLVTSPLNELDLLGALPFWHRGPTCTCTCEWVSDIKLSIKPRLNKLVQPKERARFGTSMFGADILITLNLEAQKRDNDGSPELEWWEFFSHVPDKFVPLGEKPWQWNEQVDTLVSAGNPDIFREFVNRPCAKNENRSFKINDKPQFGKNQMPVLLQIYIKVKNPPCAPEGTPAEKSRFIEIYMDFKNKEASTQIFVDGKPYRE